MLTCSCSRPYPQARIHKVRIVGSKTANPRRKYRLTLLVTLIHPRQPLAAILEGPKSSVHGAANHVHSLICTPLAVNRNLLRGQVGAEQVNQPARERRQDPDKTLAQGQKWQRGLRPGKQGEKPDGPRLGDA